MTAETNAWTIRDLAAHPELVLLQDVLDIKASRNR